MLNSPHYAGCYACKWKVTDIDTIEEALQLADLHDKEFHKKKPISYFGKTFQNKTQ